MGTSVFKEYGQYLSLQEKNGKNQYLGGHLIPQVKDDTEESQSNFDFHLSIVEFSNSSK